MAGYKTNNTYQKDQWQTTKWPSIATEFNEFFGSVAKEIDKKIPKSKRTYTDYLKAEI